MGVLWLTVVVIGDAAKRLAMSLLTHLESLMSQPINACRGSRQVRARGFTLMELLVVIAIIAVLMSFLLPMLSQARRESNKVKCLAALRDLGSAFNIYAAEFQQAYPVVAHESAPAPTPTGLVAEERHWGDLVAKYAGGQKAQITNYKDLVKLKDAKSTIWGCPEFQNSAFFDEVPTGTKNEYHPGYGMNFIAIPKDYVQTSTRNGAMAWVRTAGGKIVGSYHKSSVWGRKGADHLLLCDSLTYFVYFLPNLSLPPDMNWQGYSGSQPIPIQAPPSKWPPTTDQKMFTIDGGRHLKPGLSRDKQFGLKGVNALFADGHAATITVKEAWFAVMAPGQSW